MCPVVHRSLFAGSLLFQWTTSSKVLGVNLPMSQALFRRPAPSVEISPHFSQTSNPSCPRAGGLTSKSITQTFECMILNTAICLSCLLTFASMPLTCFDSPGLWVLFHQQGDHVVNYPLTFGVRASIWAGNTQSSRSFLAFSCHYQPLPCSPPPTITPPPCSVPAGLSHPPSHRWVL